MKQALPTPVADAQRERAGGPGHFGDRTPGDGQSVREAADPDPAAHRGCVGPHRGALARRARPQILQRASIPVTELVFAAALQAVQRPISVDQPPPRHFPDNSPQAPPSHSEGCETTLARTIFISM